MSVTTMKALTLHQPYATLIALEAKWIETRSWSTRYRGRIAIHAGAKRPPLEEDLGPDGWIGAYALGQWCDEVRHVYDADGECDCDDDENVLGRCAEASDLQPALLNDERAHGWSLATYLPLGHVVATARLADCVPMVETGTHDQFATPFPFLLVGRGRYEGLAWLRLGHEDREVSDQLPYGHFEPGRWAWLLEDIEPLAPVPATGRQGLWNWEVEA